MSVSEVLFTGGCLCGALRFEARGDPLSGFIPFIGFARAAVRFTGEVRQYRSPSARGTVSVRNFCAFCNSLVYGGERDISESFTVYAGALDDPSLFHPAIAIFTRGRPEWAALPEGMTCFEGAPG